MQAPLNGTVRLTGALHKSAAVSDDVAVSVTKNGSEVSRWDIAAGAVGDTQTQVDIPVAKGDTIALRVKSATPIDLSKLDWTPELYYLSSPDVSPVTGSDGKPLIELHPPYDVDSYPVTDLTAAQQPWTAPATESITVTPSITATSAADGSVIFSLKRQGAVAGRCTVTITDGAASPCSLSESVSAGDPLYFDFSVADPALRTKITAYSAQVTRPGHAPVTVPSALHAAADQGLLAASYRGWTYVGYNGAGARGGQALVEADLNQAFDQDSTYDPRTAKASPFLPFPQEQSWRGGDDSAWVKGSTMSASRQGLDQIGVPTTSDVAGARAVARLSRTTQDAVGGGGVVLLWFDLGRRHRQRGGLPRPQR